MKNKKKKGEGVSKVEKIRDEEVKEEGEEFIGDEQSDEGFDEFEEEGY